MIGAVIAEPWLIPAQRVAYGGTMAAMAAFQRLSELIALHAKRLAPNDGKRCVAIVDHAFVALRSLDASRFGVGDDHHLLAAVEAAMTKAFHSSIP